MTVAFSNTGSSEGVISDSAVAPLKFQFLGFPTLSGVCGVAFSKECGKRFLLFRFKPYCCSNKKPNYSDRYFQNLDAKKHTSHLISFLPFSHDIYQPLCNIYILHAGQRFPTNNLYTCIYYNNHLRNRHTFPKLTVPQIESNVRNFLRNKLLEISSFYKNRP